MEQTKPITLRSYVQQTIENYFAHLDGNLPHNLYEIILKEVESPLIQTVLKHTKNNQSIAAKILGISRGTLRKKIQSLEN